MSPGSTTTIFTAGYGVSPDTTSTSYRRSQVAIEPAAKSRVHGIF
jgi:hypothetical protein